MLSLARHSPQYQCVSYIHSGEVDQHNWIRKEVEAFSLKHKQAQEV